MQNNGKSHWTWMGWMGCVWVWGIIAPTWASQEKGEVLPKEQWSALLQRLDKAESQGTDQRGKMKITLINKDGQKRFREAIFFQKGTDRRLVQFKSPEDVAGLSVLIRGTDIHLYLPQFRRTRRIATHVKNQPFMGTDLNFDDLGSLQYGKDYQVTHAVKLKDGRYILTLVPKPGSDKPYKRLLIHLRKDGLLKKVEYYNKQDQYIKHMTRSDFQLIKSYMFPHRMKVCDMLRKHCTEVAMTQVKMDTGISGSFFTRRYLKRDLDLE